MDSEIRRYRSQLCSGGTAIILFGFWTCIKLVITMTTGLYELPGMSVGESNIDPEIYKILLAISSAVMGAGQTALSVFIGRRALKEGHGRPAGNAYLILSAAVIIVSLVSDLHFVAQSLKSGDTWAYSFLMIDIASNFALAQTIWSARRLRALEAQGGCRA